MNQLSLEITQNCNLRCKYCVYGEDYFYYRSRSNKEMEYEVTKKGIEYVFNIINERNKKEFSLSFYGGEPLLNFEIIKKIVKYSKKLFNKWKLRFSITTNGTLIDEEIINFLILNNFQVLISLDGPKDVHDAKRII
ncbi:MAG: radical SAM protein [Patescibacteria group bacterium]|nr:radical SAM protein [Patescibacteria group bacterium]